MAKTVLLLSGTCEGRVLAQALCAAGFRVHATVTRAETLANFRGTLFPAPIVTTTVPVVADKRDACRYDLPGIHLEARGFTEETFASFLQSTEVAGVLDATHPFAARITKLSHAVCSRLSVPYVRYERPDWEPPAGTVFADSFGDAARVLPSLGQRVLLTIGCKQLKHFVHRRDRLRMFARILPSEVSIAEAERAGFPREDLLCVRPPVSAEANRECFQRLGIDVLVTKASGREGGVVEKVLTAHELGLRVLMIRRPVLPGIAAVCSMEEAVRACREKMA